MTRLRLSCCLLVLGASLISQVAWGAGDASAIRRATRTEDSRYVSNYRSGASRGTHGYRSYSYHAPTQANGCRGRR